MSHPHARAHGRSSSESAENEGRDELASTNVRGTHRNETGQRAASGKKRAEMQAHIRLHAHTAGDRRIRPEKKVPSKMSPPNSANQTDRDEIERNEDAAIGKKGSDGCLPPPAVTHGGGLPDSAGDDGRGEIASPSGVERSERGR